MEQFTGMVDNIPHAINGENGNAFLLAFQDLFIGHFLDDMVVMLFLLRIIVVEELLVETELVEVNQLLV